MTSELSKSTFESFKKIHWTQPFTAKKIPIDLKKRPHHGKEVMRQLVRQSALELDDSLMETPATARIPNTHPRLTGNQLAFSPT
jgi:hypothetical protein